MKTDYVNNQVNLCVSEESKLAVQKMHKKVVLRIEEEQNTLMKLAINYLWEFK